MLSIKKISSLAIVCLLVFGIFSSAWASGLMSRGSQEAPTEQAIAQRNGSSPRPGEAEAYQYQARKQEFTRFREQARLNAGETLNIRAQINDCLGELKLQVRSRLQLREEICAEEMKFLKEAIQMLRQNREQTILEHRENIQQQVRLLREAHLQGDIEAANAALRNIQNQQQLRITQMKQVLQQLQNLLEDYHNLING